MIPRTMALPGPVAVAEAATAGTGKVNHGNNNLEWEDALALWEEFGPDNDSDTWGLPVLTVDKWEVRR